MTDAHAQKVTKHYIVNYPEHYPRTTDPHYIDFEHYRKTHIKDAKCAMADYANGDECTDQLELHHAHVEFALQNGVSLDVLEKHFPGISDPNKVGAWVESDANFTWYCSNHHRGHGGVHNASAADFEAEKWVKGLIS